MRVVMIDCLKILMKSSLVKSVAKKIMPRGAQSASISSLSSKANLMRRKQVPTFMSETPNYPKSIRKNESVLANQ